MILPSYFTDRVLQVGLNITSDNHNINHSNSKISIKPNFSEFENKFRYINKTPKEITTI